MLTHLHMMVYIWWCWHIYKGDDNGEEIYAKVNGGEHTCIARREREPCVRSASLPLHAL
jgi:hypothetical protein